MTPKTWARNTGGLLASASKRTLEAERRAVKALDEMMTEGADVNFQSVAKRGSISPAFLYGREELRKRIEGQRANQRHRRDVVQVTRSRTDAGLQVLLVARDRRIKELETEVRDLRRQLALCRGQLYDHT
jgi:hypothetical protein